MIYLWLDLNYQVPFLTMILHSQHFLEMIQVMVNLFINCLLMVMLIVMLILFNTQVGQLLNENPLINYLLVEITSKYYLIIHLFLYQHFVQKLLKNASIYVSFQMIIYQFVIDSNQLQMNLKVCYCHYLTGPYLNFIFYLNLFMILP